MKLVFFMVSFTSEPY